MNAKVSVLIPARGKCEYLIETLKSIQESTIEPYEILLIDDGINSDTLKFLKENLLKEFNLLIHKNRGYGLVAALNTGLELANGEIIARIDSDDLFTKERLSKQLEVLNSSAEIVVVGANCIYIDENSLDTGFSNYPVGRLNNLPDFAKKCILAHPSTIFVKEVALEIGGYRSVFKWNGTDIAEDFDFWLRMAKKGSLYNVPDFLIKYRQHSGQLSTQNNFGQLFGSIYISVVNKSNDPNPPFIDIHDSNRSDIKKLIRYISKRGGNAYTMILFLRLVQMKFNKKKLIGSQIHRICNRTCSYLSELV